MVDAARLLRLEGNINFWQRWCARVATGVEQNNHYFYDLLLSARRSVGWMSEIFESFSVLLIGLSGGGYVLRTIQ